LLLLCWCGGGSNSTAQLITKWFDHGLHHLLQHFKVSVLMKHMLQTAYVACGMQMHRSLGVALAALTRCKGAAFHDDPLHVLGSELFEATIRALCC
jgi:hypothetical protein